MEFNITENATDVPNFSDEVTKDQDYLGKITTILTAALAAIGIVSNTVVVFGLAKRNLRTYTNLVQSLSVANALYAALYLTYQLYYIQRGDFAHVRLPTAVFELPQQTKPSAGSEGVPTDGINGGNVDFIEDGSFLPDGLLGNEAAGIPGFNGTFLPNDLLGNVADGIPMFNDTFLPAQEEVTETSTLYKLVFLLHFVPTTASVLSMLSITIHLFISTRNPRKNPTRAPERRGTAMVVVIWSVACLVYFFPVIRVLAETLTVNTDVINNVVHRIIWLATLFIFLIMFVMYCIIFVHTNRKTLDDVGQVQLKENRKQIVVSLMVVVSYALCHLPFICYVLLENFSLVHSWGGEIWKLVFSTTFILNPIIISVVYAIGLPEVSKGILAKKRALIQLCFPKK